MKYIVEYGRKDLGTGILENKTDGGEGIRRMTPEKYYTRFTKESKRKMSASRKGKIPWNKGVPNYESQKQKISNTLSKEWIIIYPDGKEMLIRNLTKFCNENNLFQSNMIKVSQGKQKHHKGFTCRPA